MFTYLGKRILSLIGVMVGVSLLTFGMVRLAPGDPAEIVLRVNGIDPKPAAVRAMRERLGLNDSLPIQYGRWLSKVIRGDIGTSYVTRRPVWSELLQRLPATAELTLVGALLVLVVSLPLGILSAVFKNTVLDHFSRVFALAGASVPSFWLGLILIYLFAVKYPLLPVMGRGRAAHLLLPGLTLGLGMSAVYARLLRAGMLVVLGQDFIQAARARGLGEGTVILAHGLKNALLPMVTVFGMSFGHLLGGTVIVETIFAWPGMGKFLVDSIFSRDYAVIQGYAILMAMVFVTLNVLVDVSYTLIDPRVRIWQKTGASWD